MKLEIVVPKARQELCCAIVVVDLHVVVVLFLPL